MQIHEITKQQIDEGLLGDLSKKVTKQATQAYTQAKQGINQFKANPTGTLKRAGQQITQGAQQAYQRYATPAGQLQAQNEKNAASAAASADKLAMQFGAPIYQEFVAWQKSQPKQEPSAEQSKQQTQQAQVNQPPLTPAQKLRIAQNKQMSPQSGIREAEETVSAGGIVIPAGAKTATAQSQNQNQVSADPFVNSVNEFVRNEIKIDTNTLENLPYYGDQYNEAVIAASTAFEQNKPAEQKKALTKAFGIAKLAAMKLKREEGGTTQQSQTTQTRGTTMSDKQIDQTISAIKQISGGKKGNPTGIQQVDQMLTRAGVLGEVKQ